MSHDGLLIGLGVLGAVGGAAVLLSRAQGSSPPGAPPVPTGLMVSNLTGSGFTVTWNASTGAAAYIPYQLGTALPQQPGTVLNVSISSPGSTMRIAVAAVGADGLVSAQSAVLSFVLPLPLPPTPADLATSAITTTSFDFDATAQPYASGYTPYLDGVALAAVTQPSGTVTGLIPGSTHTIALDAFNSSGHSAPCTPLTVNLAVAAPLAPTGLVSSNVTQTSVDLDWGAAAMALGYTPYEDGTALLPVTANSATITGLAPASTHVFAVDAFDSGGHSPKSASITVKTLALTKPAVPTGLVASAETATGVTLSCADDPTASAYHFRVSGVVQPVSATPSIVVSGLLTKHAYTAAVAASNAGGTSAYSTSISFRTT